MQSKKILSSTIITSYLFLLSIAYLWGFWGNFGINILQFITVTDIIKSAIIPMIVTVSVYFVQLAINKYNSPTVSPKEFSKLEKPEKTINALKYAYFIILSVIVIGGAIYSLFTGTLMQKYTIVAYILGFFAYMIILKKTHTTEYLPFENKPFALSIICFLPILFLQNGVHNADNIQSGKDTFLVQSNSKCTSDNSTKYRYIDSVSDKVFALSLKDNSICIFKYEYIKLIKEKQ